MVGQRVGMMAAMVVGVAMVVGGVAVMGGCDQPRVTGELPAFAELRDRYNARTAQVEQLWARTVVEIRWEDERGRRHFEQGDGPLILRMPSELALAVGKLGNTMYWVGGDAERFWFFDLNPPNGEPSSATVGRHEDIARTGTEELPVPVRPDQLLHLLGVKDMPEPADGQVPQVTREGGMDVVRIAADAEGEAWWRYELDPANNHLPTRIVLLDAEGQEVVASALSRYQPLEREGVPPGGWPYVPTRIEITTPLTERTRMTLFMADPTDGKARDRVREAQFDFERLVEMLNPDEVREVQP